MYPYGMIAFHSNQVKSNPICGSQDSNCGHTNRSVQVKRYIWQVSLFLKIAIKVQPQPNNNVDDGRSSPSIVWIHQGGLTGGISDTPLFFFSDLKKIIFLGVFIDFQHNLGTRIGQINTLYHVGECQSSKHPIGT